jgi:hypothetical protein
VSVLNGVTELLPAAEKNSQFSDGHELTECQVHTAIAALIPFWWLGMSPPKKLLERTSEEIQRTQQRNAQARKCHTTRTRQRLHALGIKLAKLPRCCWDST